MECLYGFASSVSRDLVCGALNQLRYPCCFKNFVKKLEEEEKYLIITKDSVQKFVTHNKKQARKPSEIVDKWLEDAINDVHNVNQLLEEARTQKHSCFGHCPNWIWRYHVGKKLANKTMDLEKFIEEGRKYVPLDRIATLPSNTLDMLSEKCINFDSRQSAYEQLLDAVKTNDVSMIGLYGMGGCGKTTLAIEVRKLVEAEQKVLFVAVSSTVEVRRIQEKIASSLQFQFPEIEEMQRAQRLCSRLTQENNIFIILDDVWEKLDFGRIGIPSSEHHKGCKILITSRSEAVCTLMDCQRKIYLPILTDEEAWTLFQNKALISEGTPHTLKNLGRLISDECKGLPVAIAAVACSLKGKAETVWSVALNKLRRSKPINIERGLIDPYKCLQLSYDNLDTKEAKFLFLLCSVFPEDTEIPVEVLTRCAIGLGVVGEVDSYEEGRSEVIAAKIKLVSCCLLLDADHERVKMHDIVRDVAHIIAKNENKMIKCEVEKDVRVEQNSVRYLWCEKFPNDLDCSNLEFLCLRTKMKGFDEIFKRMGMLKVLILVNDEDEETRLSTISFKTLTNLRYLFIENYELSDFSFLGGMKNLQSLELYNCLLPSFPELQTDFAITLKLLELRGCDIEVKNFEVMKRIPLLEELYIIDIEGEWDANSVDNIEFFKTFSIPETLQRYGIVLGSDSFYHYNDEDVYIDGRTLLLNHFDISNEIIKGLAKKAKDLFVRNIHGGAKNMIPDIFQIEGGSLNELNTLEIRFSKELECLIDTRSHSSEVVTLFSKLHTLEMKDMKNLKAIWHCFLPANGPFENLEELYLTDCPRLTFLFTYVVARSLVKLKILKISGCNELKHILTYDEKSEDEFTSGHPVQIFQNLQEVEIDICPELKHIFSTNIVGGLTQLKVLEIKRCEMLDQIIGDRKEELDEIVEEGTLSNLASLKITWCRNLGSIFTASIAKTLTSLEELFIHECKSLKDIVTHESIVEDEHDCESDISIFQSLRLEKLELKSLPRMTYIWVGPNNSLTLQHLTTLEIWNCGKLEVIFPKSVVRFLPKLKLLKIRKCKELRQIIEGDKKLSNLVSPQPCFPKLEALQVDDCHKLKRLFSEYASNDLPNLHLLAINGANELEELVGSKEGKIKVELPRLKLLIFMHLPNFSQEIGLHNLKNCIAYNCQKLSFTSTSTLEKLRLDFPYKDFINTELHSRKFEEIVRDIFYNSLARTNQSMNINNNKKILFTGIEDIGIGDVVATHVESDDEDIVRSIDDYSTINGSSELTSSQEENEDVGNESIKSSSTRVEDIGGIEGAVATHIESGGEDILALDTKVVEQDSDDSVIPQREKEFDKLCEEAIEVGFESSWVEEMRQRVVVSDPKLGEDIPQRQIDENSKRCSSGDVVEEGDGPKIRLEEGSDLVDKEGEIGVLSKDHIFAPRNEEAEQEFVAEVFTSEIPRIEKSTPSHLYIPVRETPSNPLVDTQLTSEPCQMKQKKPVGEIPKEIRDVGNESIKEDPLVEGAKTKSSSTGVEDIGIGGAVANHVESGGEEKLALDSKVVEQDDKMKECKAGTVASQGIQVEEGLNLLHKQEGIHVSNNNIDISSDIRTRLGAYKNFVDLDDAQISLLMEAITTYPHLWNASKKFSERFQAWRLKILVDMLLFLQKESVHSVIPQKEKEFHKLCEEAIEIGFESSWVEEMRQRVVGRDPKLEEDIAKRQIDENSMRCSSGDMVRDSQTFEEGDGPKISLEEGSNLVDKEGEVSVVSNDHILAPRNEEAEQEFVAEVFTSEIPRIATSLTNSQTVEKPTSSNPLVDTQQTSEPCLMEQKKTVGEIPKGEINSSQIDARIAKESEGHPKIIQDFGANDITSLFAPVVVRKEGEDKLVGKTLAELEKYLKMSLKDIVSSETNSLCLLSALNFLSNLPFKDVKVSDGLKHIIDTMHRHFPSILCSFKQGFAATNNLAELEARANEVTIKKNFYDELQRKEVVLKEQINRLKEELRVCEVALSSVKEEKNKCIAETVEYKKELENARKEESQMLEVAHKWSLLCSQYELNRMAATNPS